MSDPKDPQVAKMLEAFRQQMEISQAAHQALAAMLAHDRTVQDLVLASGTAAHSPFHAQNACATACAMYSSGAGRLQLPKKQSRRSRWRRIHYYYISENGAVREVGPGRAQGGKPMTNIIRAGQLSPQMLAISRHVEQHLERMQTTAEVAKFGMEEISEPLWPRRIQGPSTRWSPPSSTGRRWRERRRVIACRGAHLYGAPAAVSRTDARHCPVFRCDPSWTM